MRQKFGKSFILIPLGLCWNAMVFALAHFKLMPDFMQGALTGFGIGLMLTPFIFKKMRQAGC